MALEHYFSQDSKTIPNAVTEAENSNGCFDCNICLDFAYEPVVTLCGHLHCWPCIYKWLHVQSDSLAPDEPPQCLVCKADISHTTMVPLYGRAGARPQLIGKHHVVVFLYHQDHLLQVLKFYCEHHLKASFRIEILIRVNIYTKKRWFMLECLATRKTCMPT